MSDDVKKNPEVTNIVNKATDKLEHVAPPTSWFKKHWYWLVIGGAVIIALLAVAANAATPGVSVHTPFYM